MPLIFQNYNELYDCHVAVWEKTEPDEHFFQTLNISTEESLSIHELKDHRKSEWLCSRALLKKILGKKQFNLFKDSYGKPFLENSPYFISLSHSQNRAAVIVSKNIVGIDIQRQEEKIVKLFPKFISEPEQKNLDETQLVDSYHIFWGAKEAMYKAYGKKNINFNKHMHLYAFKNYQDQLELSGQLVKEELFHAYKIFTHKLHNFYLVYAVLLEDLNSVK